MTGRLPALACGLVILLTAVCAEAQSALDYLTPEQRRRVIEAEQEAARLNSNKEQKKVSSVPTARVLFADVSWRVSGDPPSRVPKFVEVPGASTPSGFDALGSAWSGQLGAIYNSLYASANFDLYRGEVRDGTTPYLLQVNAGWGKASKVWTNGGPIEVKTYKSEMVDKYGATCPKVESYTTVLDARVDLRARGCGTKVKVTETTQFINQQPGWSRLWYAVYGGWRQVGDMLGGDADDAMRPLNNGGGPVIGASAFFSADLVGVEIGHELAYYAHGWDDHGKLGYNGRAGVGYSRFAFLDLRWRLDSAVGKEFMLGLRLRLDLFGD